MSRPDGPDTSKHGVENPGFTPESSTRNELAKTSSGQLKPVMKVPPSNPQKNEKEILKEQLEAAEEEVDISCGIWKFRTHAFGRKFANLYVFTIMVGFSMLFTQMINSVLHVQLPSIERQFNISNARAGLFDTASKAGHLSTILLAGHFARKVNIPVVIGLAGMFQGLVLMVPAFLQLANPYTLQQLTSESSGNSTHKGDNARYVCNYSSSSHNTTKEEHHGLTAEYSQMAFIIICVVQAVKGVSDTFHSGFLPTIYVDNNVLDKSQLGIFFGIKYVLNEIAFPAGRQINAYLTKVPVDLKNWDMDSQDPRFVAAWWLSFLMFGAATFVFSFPIILFPRNLVSKRQQQEALEKAMVSFSSAAPPPEKTISDKVKASDTLRKPSVVVIGVKNHDSVKEHGKRTFTPQPSLKRGSFLSHVSSRKSSLMPPINGPSERKVSFDGSMVFDQPLPDKKLEPKKAGKLRKNITELVTDFPVALARVFRQPVYILMLVDIALVSIPQSGISIFRSSYTQSQFNISMFEVATLTSVLNAVTSIMGTLLSGFLANRVHTKMGYMWIIFLTALVSICISPSFLILGCNNEPIYGSTGRFGISVNETGTCGCSKMKSLLSCGSDGRNYLNPCHAGCLDMQGKGFANCTLLDETLRDADWSLKTGLCALPHCRTNFYLYVGLHAVQSLIHSLANIPRRLLLLRIVDPRDRAFATSLFAFFGTVVGLPSPNLFGRVIDNACLINDGNTCTLYNRDTMRYLMSGVDVGSSGVVLITLFVQVLLFRHEEKKQKRKLQEEAENGEGKEVN